VTGKRRDAGLGTYPETTIADACEKALAMRKILDADRDPIDGGKRERESASIASAALTFEKAARAVHEALKPSWRNEKHRNDWIRSLEAYVFPKLGGKVLSDMVLTSFLRRVEAKSVTLGRIVKAHGFRSSFRDWASENGYARDLAERALAHTVANKVEAAYHQTDLL
jgi:integrase